MSGQGSVPRLLLVSSCAMLTATGCAFQGLNSLPLPGAVGRGPGANIYHVEIANVGTLESNSPVMINDVVVGSISKMTVQNWHADVEISVKPGTVVPANAVANVGQTSLLGSMHVELNPPLGQPAAGPLAPGATIPLNRSSTYPSTEQTLSSLSAVINGGGLGQLGDIIHNTNVVLSGHENQIRDLLTRLDDFVGTLDDQRDNLIASIQQLNRLAGTFAGQRDVITAALNKIPPALDVLIRERPHITEALTKLGVFSDTATRLINDSKADLVKNLQNLEPTFSALADIGPGIDDALQYATVFPFGQNVIDRGVRGDFMNLFAIVDLTVTRLRHGLLLGTRWGTDGAELVPAPGDAGYDAYYRANPGNELRAIPPEGAGPPPPMGTGGLARPPWAVPPPPQPAGLPPTAPWGQPAPPPYWDQVAAVNFPPKDEGG
ncbi:MAG: MCE-family lipoprotein [Mycobacterium sp.]|jgi:phospholipid/cholesterol/gamma-HCH transport system substrate-binding protein|nr:MCE-family lipoprotein [Mycobacterium sp.]MDT5230738.1 phospholipid/cholesterol/gamma-HCH transport system substrate-binding protein [Mycobacterium sp.]